MGQGVNKKSKWAGVGPQLTTMEQAPVVAPRTADEVSFEERLSALPREVLASLISSACSVSPELRGTAENCLKRHEEMQRLFQGVLLSADLLPRVLVFLASEDACVACVCSTWRRCWAATAMKRGVRPAKRVVPLEMSDGVGGMAVLPAGRALCVASTSGEDDFIDELDHTLQRVRRWRCPRDDESSYGDLPIAAGSHGLYMVRSQPGRGGGSSVRRLSPDGSSILAEYRDRAIWQIVSVHVSTSGVGSSHRDGAGGGAAAAVDPPLLYAAVRGSNGAMADEDQILALDALTLTRRFRFGAGIVRGVREVARVGTELYVASGAVGVLHVFSLSGCHLRDLRGRWRTPWLLRYTGGRLYMVEDAYNAADAADALDPPTVARAKRQAGKRVLVISPADGRLLQVCQPPPAVRGLAASRAAAHAPDAAGAAASTTGDRDHAAAAANDDAGVIVHMVTDFGGRMALAVSNGTGGVVISAFDL